MRINASFVSRYKQTNTCIVWVFCESDSKVNGGAWNKTNSSIFSSSKMDGSTVVSDARRQQRITHCKEYSYGHILLPFLIILLFMMHLECLASLMWGGRISFTVVTEVHP